ncbi:hypothetical protein [Galbibacter sp.]|uniref:hypothetical protein n=1 Tax=Galbibacter sp. TaxID=2918471 RepID=UPI003A8DEDBE
MKKIMEANHVIKIVIIVLMFPFLGKSQEKYLLYKPEKDSIICKGEDLYYIIDENLFDINRYNKIDTIDFKKIQLIEFSTVSNLYTEAKKNFLEVSDEKNLFIETFNEIFEYVYILEKLPECKYKRTRVWWIDY